MVQERYRESEPRLLTERRVLVLGEEDYDALLLLAQKSSRKRAIRTLHEPWEHANRMLNAILPESYVRPHKHENLHASDTMTALRGVFTVLIFNDEGEIINTIDVYGKKVVDIPPNTWHSVVVQTPCVLFEIKGQPEGGYNPETDKTFAPWAPKEGTEEAELYLEELKERIFESD